MFEHPGEKVKSFALIFFWITVIGGGITAIVTAVAAGSFWLFLGIALGSLICAYLSGLFLSGFGELIESTQENAATNKQILRKLESSGPDQHPSATSPAPAQQRAAIKSNFFMSSFLNFDYSVLFFMFFQEKLIF